MARRILLVEDEKDIQTLVKMAMEHIGKHMVVTADNGVEGLQQAEAQQPDLILLDVMMPRMDGFEMLTKLRENPKTQHIPVIFLTARAQQREVRAGMNLGAIGYITKPFDAVQLNRRVEAIWEKAEAEGRLPSRP